MTTSLTLPAVVVLHGLKRTTGVRWQTACSRRFTPHLCGDVIESGLAAAFLVGARAIVRRSHAGLGGR